MSARTVVLGSVDAKCCHSRCRNHAHFQGILQKNSNFSNLHPILLEHLKNGPSFYLAKDVLGLELWLECGYSQWPQHVWEATNCEEVLFDLLNFFPPTRHLYVPLSYVKNSISHSIYDASPLSHSESCHLRRIARQPALVWPQVLSGTCWCVLKYGPRGFRTATEYHCEGTCSICKILGLDHWSANCYFLISDI